MNDNAIVLKNVYKSFVVGKLPSFNKGTNQSRKVQKFRLENISFSVKKGTVLGIIGKNGSGKTTLLRLIAGVYKPEKGNIRRFGRLSPLMQLGAGYQGELNAKDNIRINGMLLGLTRKEIESKIKEIIEYAELKEFTELKLKHFSSGMRARLAFATTMQVDPDILLVDEILSVGDHEFRKKSFDEFVRLKKEGKTIIHTTHNLLSAKNFSDEILFLDKGKQISIGKPDIVIEKYKKQHLEKNNKHDENY